jgi:fumarylacetoacetate (FAA) hydrolase
LQQSLEDWTGVADLTAEYVALNAGKAANAIAFDPPAAMAPLPRAWQWLDGLAFESHGNPMDTIFGIKKERTNRPLMYQGVSNRCYGATDDIPCPRKATTSISRANLASLPTGVPMGITVVATLGHIRLLVQINDWSLRRIASIEMKTGFGWVQAKPPCSMSPVAVTPDEASAQWPDARVDIDLLVDWSGKRFGAANGYAMGASFAEFVAHAAYSRTLVPGTVIGSGTVSNANFREVGSSCIAERRGIEIRDLGGARTDFMHFGDRVRMEAVLADGTSLFGAIDQRVVKG